ncbi:putative transmembrane protein [Gregarina niphandrodes]|uniref:Transmembrane protein n=1 Tax=Gregarina niphandrodes TaxID=110365 RepID=A0A023B330_GRENI|nr:putative transmembrane protein [Gregarina niphandrodes]EZG55044.1 putative transmembrane protein [Gregarina niphandrodes]|eukprot:XP_011131811.1 putative transmembrane protein [Gregarina niphandrodes]
MKELFLAVAALSFLSSLDRPEYNLPIFLFLYWTHDSLSGDKRWRQQRFFLSLVVSSILLDLVYILYWAPLKFSRSWEAWTHWSHALTKWTMSVAAIILLVKIGIVIFMFRPELMVLCGLKAKEDVIEEYDIVKYLPLPQSKA